jgi:hypothetical protein
MELESARTEGHDLYAMTTYSQYADRNQIAEVKCTPQKNLRVLRVLRARTNRTKGLSSAPGIAPNLPSFRRVLPCETIRSPNRTSSS